MKIRLENGEVKNLNQAREWTSLDNNGNRQSYVQSGQVVYIVCDRDANGAIWCRV